MLMSWGLCGCAFAQFIYESDNKAAGIFLFIYLDMEGSYVFILLQEVCSKIDVGPFPEFQMSQHCYIRFLGKEGGCLCHGYLLISSNPIRVS